MVSLMHFSFRKLLLLYLVLFLFNSLVLIASTDDSMGHRSKHLLGRRRLLEMEEEDEGVAVQTKKKSSVSFSKNQTKLLKPNSSTKNQTKLVKSNLSSKNQTKILKLKPTNSTKSASISSLSKSELKKLNSTSLIKKLSSSNSQLKKLNSTSKATNSTKSSSYPSSSLLKLSSPKNKTKKSTTTKQIDPESPKPKKEQSQSQSQSQSTEKKATTQEKSKQKQKQKQPSWIDQDEDEDLVSEFRDLPNKFQKTLIPDLERISTQSKAYITKYNKEITNQFKPIVGKKHAPTIATAISIAFILIPLILVSLIVNRIKAYFSLQKVLIFIQVYLSIYFSILSVSSLVTGLEPLRFFYASSPGTYICLQVFQTLGYVLYLLMLLMYLVLVFSTECGLGSKFLGLSQTFVGFAVGLHYYVAVFHRVVLRQPPKTNWKVHGIYATCFLLICVASQAERRKKSYLEEDGEEGKKN